MKKISYLLIVFVSVFALMVVSADAGRGGRGGGYGRVYIGGGYGGGYYGGWAPGYSYQNGNKTCVWNGYKWRCCVNPAYTY